MIRDFDLQEMKKSVSFRNNTLETSLMDKEDIITFFEFVEEFCKNHGISNKQVNETLIVYPKDYDKINEKRYELSKSYVAFYRSVESMPDYGDFQIDRIDFDIDDNYDMNIDSLEDVKRVLLEIHNNVQKDTSVYTTEAEKQAVIDRRKKESDEIIVKQQKKLKKAEDKLRTKLISLDIMDEDLEELIKLKRKVKKAFQETL